MIHQVNLYKAEFRPRKLLLSFRHLLAATAATLVLAVSASVALKTFNHKLSVRVAGLTAEAESLDAGVATLAETLERREQDRSLQRQIDRVQQDLARGAKVVALLREQRVKPGEKQQFSRVMQAFSRQSKQGVWLREIAIDESGFRFDGFVDAASHLPSYLEGLGQEPVFLGQRFSGLHISHGDAGQPLSFTLRSLTAPGGGSQSIALGRKP